MQTGSISNVIEKKTRFPLPPVKMGLVVLLLCHHYFSNYLLSLTAHPPSSSHKFNLISFALPVDIASRLQPLTAKLVFSVAHLFSGFSCLWLWSLSLLQFVPQQTARVIPHFSLGPFSAYCQCWFMQLIIISNLLSLSPVSGQ